MDDQAQRQQLCRASQKLWARGLVAGDSGLVSVEFTRRRYLVTPVGLCRGELRPHEVMTVDLGGVSVQGEQDLDASYWRPHRSAYHAGIAAEGPEDHVRATAMTLPPAVIGLSRAHPCDVLRLPGGLFLKVVDHQDEALDQVCAEADAVIVKPLGLFVSGPSLDAVLNLTDRLNQAAMIEIMARQARGC